MTNDPADVAVPPASTGPDHRAARARRKQIGADLAQTVLATTARRLAEAISEFDGALDRHATLIELQDLDREVARARREHAAARLSDGEAPSRSR